MRRAECPRMAKEQFSYARTIERYEATYEKAILCYRGRFNSRNWYGISATSS
jgi:hypothetical protein